MDFVESMILVHHVDTQGMDVGRRGEIPSKHVCVDCFVFVADSPPTRPLRHLEDLSE